MRGWAPDSSALIVVLEDRWVQDVQRDMQKAQAREVIASQILSGNTSGGAKSGGE
jgi:hypothetical protein